jgi:hypothetical protein
VVDAASLPPPSPSRPVAVAALMLVPETSVDQVSGAFRAETTAISEPAGDYGDVCRDSAHTHERETIRALQPRKVSVVSGSTFRGRPKSESFQNVTLLETLWTPWRRGYLRLHLKRIHV